MLASCENVSVSGGIKCARNGKQSKNETQSCSSYQQSDSLPDQPPPRVIRVAVGGDSRSDKSHILPWSFREAKRRGAKAFFFLGDLELSEAIDKRVLPELAELGDIPFYPVIGNHEVDMFGILRERNSESLKKVEKFKKEFHLTDPGVHLAPFPDTVVYSVDFEQKIHFIALDNVSRKGGGFGLGQLAWLAEDLSKANAEKKIILVGMHKGLANNPVTSHAMDEDGSGAVEDSEAAVILLEHHKAGMVFVSHSHMYAAYPQDRDGILQVRLTGGMGAPLVKDLAEADGGFHHFLLVDVTPGNSQTTLHVQVVKWPCTLPCTPCIPPCKGSVSDTEETKDR
jgi:hypothetical protein